ncbi:hypothetical protein [Delftia acidovorans]|uniref:hypothetical protein n=1 Tax=Delftia acidovorans TaxID=80866 RepID=UPI0030188EEF
MKKHEIQTSAAEQAHYMKLGSNGRANYRASVGNSGYPRRIRNEPDPKNQGGDYFASGPGSFGGGRNASLNTAPGKKHHSHNEDHAYYARLRDEAIEKMDNDYVIWRKESNENNE